MEGKEDLYKFEASLVYKVSSRQLEVLRKTLSQKKKRKRKMRSREKKKKTKDRRRRRRRRRRGGGGRKNIYIKRETIDK